MLRRRCSAGLVAIVTVWISACGRLPSGIGTRPTIWVMAPAVVLDSASFRPVSPVDRDRERLPAPAAPAAPAAPVTSALSTLKSPGRRVAVVTSFQGERYHPETIRALAADSQALGATAGAIAALASTMSANGFIVDLQGMTAADIRALIEVTRAIADSARAYVLGPIGFVVPAADTAGYPGALIARTADLIVVRLDGEHRPGTSPGPVASLPWFARHLGMRASEVGASRVAAELPLFGYRWERDGSARRITYQQARAAVLGEATAFRRDPASRALHAASPRDGWQIWINDHETIAFLISAARRIGVNRFALAGAEGADAEVWATLRKLGRATENDTGVR